MSTKIYYGVRFHLSRLGEFVEQTRIKGLKAVEEQARRFLSCMKDPKLTGKDRKLRGKARASRLLWKKAGEFVKFVGEAARDPRVSGFDLTFGWSLFVAPGSRWVLATPWGSLARDAKRLAPRWIEEYGYWDNTDPPEEVTAREWRRRRLAWELACAPDYERHALTLFVFDAQTSRYTSDMSWLELRLVDHRLENGRPFGAPAPARAYSKRMRQIEAEMATE